MSTNNNSEDEKNVEQETNEESPKGEQKRKSIKSNRTRGRINTNNQLGAKSNFKGETNALKDDVFVFHQIHNKHWMTSRQKFINYAGKTYGGNEETSLELRKVTVVTIDPPTQPTSNELAAMTGFEKEMAKEEFKQDRKAYKDVIQKTRINLTKLFKVLWGQCDPIMKNKIKADKEYKEAHAQKSVIKLLGIIETVCEQGDGARNRRVQRFLAKKKVYNFRQTDEMDLGEYLEKFEILVNVAEKLGAQFYDDEDMEEWISEEADIPVKQEPIKTSAKGPADDKTPQPPGPTGQSKHDNEINITKARDRALAIIFFMNANEAKYAVYKQECHNAMTKGRDEYPRDVIEAHTQLEDYKFNPRFYQTRGSTNRPRHTGHQFVTSGSGPNGQGDYICYNCDRKNECMAYNCPHMTKENGDPTQNERKRIQRERREQISGDLCLNEGVVEDESDDNESAMEDTESWTDELDGDNYGITLFNGNTDVLIEDVRGNNKHTFNQCKRRMNPRWILLDNCSSVNVFYNKRFLSNIRKAANILHLYTNAGKAIITMVGDLPGFGEVYYYPKGIANILSFHAVTNLPGYRVEYNNGIEDAFRVTNPSGSTRRFVPSNKGLYYWDSSEEIKRGTMLLETTLGERAVATVRGNREKFSRRDNTNATRARDLQNVTNWSDQDMMRVAKYGPLMNNPFTPRDISVMRAILGPSATGLQGKTVRRTRGVVGDQLVPVPRQIMDYYHDVIMSIDVMHVNELPFLVTITKHVHYGTATFVRDMKADSLSSVIKELDKFYRKRGFKIGMILADKQFQALRNQLGEITLNLAAQEEHVPEIKRFIRTIKERARCAINHTPFKTMPKTMIIGMMSGVLLYLNGLPWTGGISKILSPLTIVTRRKLDYKLHCQIPFRAYAHVRRTTDNTLRPRTFGAIALAPMDNMQGGMRFMNLRTGREIERDRPDYTVLPMPDEVIDRVHELAGEQQGVMTFTNRLGDKITDLEAEQGYDSEEDSDYEYQSESESETEEDDDGDSISISQSMNEEEDPDDSKSIESTGMDAEGENIENTGVDTETIIRNLEEDGEVIEFTQSDSEETTNTDSGEEDTSEDEPLGRPECSNRGQPHSWRGFEDAFTNLGTDDKIELIRTGEEQHNCHRALSFLAQADQRTRETVTHYVMNQYGLKEGLKHFGEEGKFATTKEMKQMLSREVFEEIEYESLSNMDKRRALPILLFLTQKRDGTVKGQACADGRKQRIWMNKEDTRSPTVATEALFYLVMMFAYEGRDVATLDLPGHFLQTPMEGRLILRVDGDLALTLVELDKKRWSKYLKKVKGKWVIFVKCSKAIYGTLNAALLSYKKLIGHLDDWGYKMNPYDHCVWNKNIDGTQMTVAFHVDDMIISHVNPAEVDKLIAQLRAIYGKTDPMTERRGRTHEYLGMSIDFNTPGEVRITMYDYIQKMLNALPKEMQGEKTTAAPENLFQTGDADLTKKLDEATKDYFHTTTAQALYLGKRGRPDLQTAVAFLCTRVRDPNEHDYRKLTHLMKYIQATRHLPLILRYKGGEVSLYIMGHMQSMQT